ncbi:hypothetical protein MNBD_UNCLBAC01-1974 [hydrothermal vent metagenome]|uniref:Uncharacterized protein n=1 Tax=hydrothermal vent metagenome TaxID=652676 RepID=A0A3B1DPD3_9ZZZZ
MNCLKCNSNITAENSNSKNWCVVKITNLKKRGFEVTGFPHAGFVTVRGWKLEKVQPFTTDLCNTCVSQYIKQQNTSQSKKIEIINKTQKWLNIVGPLLGCVLLLSMYLISHPKSDETLSSTNVFILIFSSISIISPLLFSMIKPQNNMDHHIDEEILIKKIHRKFINDYQLQLSKSLNTNILPLILHPEPMMPGPIININLHFIIPESTFNEYATSEQKTGWSRIDYYARFGTYSPGPYEKYLQKRNKEDFGFKHWGEFLSKPIEELKHIIGIAEVEN